MSQTVSVPSLGESVVRATLSWLKKEGDQVRVDEPVAEVESDKATIAVPAPASGVLTRIAKPNGSEVKPGEALAEIEPAPAKAEVAKAATAGAPKGEPTDAATKVDSAVPSEPAAPRKEPLPQRGARATPAAARTRAARPRPTPSERRRLAERSPGRPVALEPGPAPLSPSGRVAPLAPTRTEPTVESVQAELAPAAPERKAPAGDRERVVPMSRLRLTVARRLVEAQRTAAILTTFNEADMTAVIAMRGRHQADFQERHGVKLGFMSFFVKASVEALRAFPMVNAEVRGERIAYHQRYDIGVAVGGGKGLVVPVVRDADRLSFAGVEQAIAELAGRARENKLLPADLEGGTFTISNGGVYGSLLSTPILNPPQSAILGLHKIERRPVAIGEAVEIRSMMYLALSYDHRIVDGREAVQFLARIKASVEAPERLLFDL
jgi:2-oxoglutarate dehydrogenase E2 component (dihydrolipoamide succinyltransferase)